MTKERIIAERSISTERYILSTMPVLYLPLYRLDSGESGGSFTSADGHGHTCTVTDALISQGGREFDGSDDKIDCGKDAILDLPNALTVIVWVWLDSTGSGYRAIISDNNAAGNKIQYQIDIRDSTDLIRFALNTGGGILLESPSGLGTDAWHQIAITRVSATEAVIMYLDGVEIASGTSTSTAAFADAGNTVLGRPGDLSASYFKGKLGEALLYNKTFTRPEVEEVFQVTEWRYR